MMMKKQTKKILMISIYSAIVILSFTQNISKVQGDVTFDPKLQLNNYLSYGADIIDSKITYLDDDSNLDLIVAYADRVVIYEDNGNGFILVDEIKTGDSNFIPDSSNISAIGVGDVLDRASLDVIDSIMSITNSSGCVVNNPYPHDTSYLESDDGQRYNLTFTAGGMGNFSVNFSINFGLSVSSFDLKIVIRDRHYDIGSETALLSIYDNVDAEWETWLNLDGQVVEIDTDLQIASNVLSNSITNYVDSDNLVKVKFLYSNASGTTDVNIDYLDLVNITAPSIKDIVVGGGKGELSFIQSNSLTTNQYSASRLLDFTDYGNGGVANSKRMISDILLGDVDNNNRSNILASITGESTYFLQANKSVSKDYERLQEIIVTPVGNTITSLAAYDPTLGEGGNYTLCIGTRSGSYFKTVFDNVTNTFGTLSQVPTGSPITTIAIADVTSVTGSSRQEVIIGTLGGTVGVYDLEYSVNIWKDSTLVLTGNQIISITVGDFDQSGVNLIALGTSQDQQKIIVLEDTNNDGKFTSYWDSHVYMRERLVRLDIIENPSGVDTLVSTNKRHILFLSSVYSDTDGDLLSDLGELYFYRTYPDKADSDEDGLADGLEIFYYKTDPLNPDTDGDFIPDGLEVAMGTDPLDPMSSLIVYIVIPVIIFLAIFSVVYLVRKSAKEKKAEYERIKGTSNLMPQVQRLVLQRLESFSKESNFKSKAELAKFRRGLNNNMMAIVLDRLYNFLEYLRLKGIIFSDREEDTLKRIVNETMEPIVEKTDTLLKSLLMYETKYKQFNEQFDKVLKPYADWKKAAKKGTKIIEQLIKCPECETLQPAGSAFCLECGKKLVK